MSHCSQVSQASHNVLCSCSYYMQRRAFIQLQGRKLEVLEDDQVNEKIDDKLESGIIVETDVRKIRREKNH